VRKGGGWDGATALAATGEKGAGAGAGDAVAGCGGGNGADVTVLLADGAGCQSGAGCAATSVGTSSNNPTGKMRICSSRRRWEAARIKILCFQARVMAAPENSYGMDA
jgi:hypothetical protein